jgi:hypothetical protein
MPRRPIVGASCALVTAMLVFGIVLPWERVSLRDMGVCPDNFLFRNSNYSPGPFRAHFSPWEVGPLFIVAIVLAAVASATALGVLPVQRPALFVSVEILASSLLALYGLSVFRYYAPWTCHPTSKTGAGDLFALFGTCIGLLVCVSIGIAECIRWRRRVLLERRSEGAHDLP